MIGEVGFEEREVGVKHIYFIFNTGAITAIHDAIALHNLLYAMPTKTSSNITHIFEEYYREKYPAVMDCIKNSMLLSKATERGLIGAIVLSLFTHIPLWLW